MQAIRDASLAWQRARQAASKAAPADRAAADAAVLAARDARQDAIDARNRAREQATLARDAGRASALAAQESEYLREDVLGRIGPDHVQGERMMAMLRDWVRAAAERPDDPESFTPLFLAEMARLQDAPVDLLGSRYARPGRGEGAEVDLRGAPRAQQLRWTLLELELFAAAFDRGTAGTPTPAVASGGGRFVDALIPAAHASSACDDFKQWLDRQTRGFGGDAASTAAGIGTGRAIDAAAGTIMDATTREAFGQAMSALGMVAKLAKLAAFYRDKHVSVTPDPASVHKPTGDMKLVWFAARAGISQEDWDAYRRAVGEAGRIDRSARGCMDMMGLPRFADAVDVARDAENWFIEWRLSDGGGDHDDALLELLTGWYQAMNMPKAYGTMEVEYHCPRPGRLHRPTGREVADGGGDPGPDACLLSAQK